MVRGSKGGLQSSAAARCSSNRVAGGAGIELSPAAGRSRRATLTRRARARASFAPRAPGAREARALACTRAVLARGTGGASCLAFLEGIITPLGSPRHPYAVLAQVTVGARTRAGSAVLARGTVGANRRFLSAVLARSTGLAFSLAVFEGVIERTRGIAVGITTSVAYSSRTTKKNINCFAGRIAARITTAVAAANKKAAKG